MGGAEEGGQPFYRIVESNSLKTNTLKNREEHYKLYASSARLQPKG